MRFRLYYLLNIKKIDQPLSDGELTAKNKPPILFPMILYVACLDPNLFAWAIANFAATCILILPTWLRFVASFLWSPPKEIVPDQDW